MYVYILKSRIEEKKYVGLTNDVHKRLTEHNHGQLVSTRKHRPWKIIVKFWFENPDTARRFELYLKTGSGREFTKRHLL